MSHQVKVRTAVKSIEVLEGAFSDLFGITLVRDAVGRGFYSYGEKPKYAAMIPEELFSLGANKRTAGFVESAGSLELAIDSMDNHYLKVMLAKRAEEHGYTPIKELLEDRSILVGEAVSMCCVAWQTLVAQQSRDMLVELVYSREDAELHLSYEVGQTATL